MSRSIFPTILGLLKGLLKFLLVASFPVIANIGLATAFYSVISDNPIWAQIAGISIVFIINGLSFIGKTDNTKI